MLVAGLEVPVAAVASAGIADIHIVSSGCTKAGELAAALAVDP